MNRAAIAAASGAALVIAALAVFFWPSTVDTAPPESTALVALAKVVQGQLSPQIVAYGEVAADPDFATTLVMPRDAVVASIAVRSGQSVEQSDPILTIETSPGATAQFEQAKSAATFAAKDLAHTRELFAEQLATKSQLDAATKANADAQAVLAQQQRIGADRHVEVLHAPAAGVVTAVNATLGQHLTADTVVASIGTRDKLIVNLGLEPEEAPGVAIGARVAMHSPQNGQLAFDADVILVNAMVDPQSRLVDVVVRVPVEAAAQLILGTTLIARVFLPPQQGIVVPRDALLADENGTYVVVVQKSVVHRRAVKIAFETDEKALIASGLVDGELVTVAGGVGLQDGTAVRTR